VHTGGSAPLSVNTALQELAAGLATFALMLPLAIMAGVIVYAPMGPHYATTGAYAGLFCAAIGALLTGLLRTNSSVISSAVSSFALVQASGLAMVVAILGAQSPLLPTVLPAMVLLAGLLQVLIAATGAAQLVKSVSFPVVSGFVSGLAILLIGTFAPALLGAATWADVWTGTFAPGRAALSIALVAVAVLLHHRPKSRPWSLVITFVLGIAAYHALQAIGLGLGTSLGGTFEPGRPFADLGHLAEIVPAFGHDLLALTGHIPAVIAIVLAAGTMALVSLFDTVFATRAAQGIADFPAAPRRDMAALGIGSIVISMLGGVMPTASRPLSLVAAQAGSRSRIAGMVAGLLLLGLIAFDPTLLALVPICVVPPLAVAAGLRLIEPYTGAILRRAIRPPVDAQASQARRNAIIHMVVLVPTAFNLPLLGLAAGLMLSCFVFIASMNRPVIRRARAGHAVHSKRFRNRPETELLRDRNQAIAVMDLDGPLFFGNAEDLATAIGHHQCNARFIILNLRAVTDMDATGGRIVEHTRRAVLASGRKLLVAGMPSAIAPLMDPIFPPEHRFVDLDDALEHVEDALLLEHAPSDPVLGTRQAGALIDLADFDLCEGASPAQLAALSALLRQESLPAGSVLCREGELATCIWLIRAGAISVRLRTGPHERRIAAYGAGTTIGEMAVIENKPRSATLIADEPVTLYVLSLAAYRMISSEQPDLAALLFRNISRDLSARLRARSSELKAALA